MSSSKKERAVEATRFAVGPVWNPADPLHPEFGLAAPGTALLAWGFRGIKEGGGFGLAYDRQSYIAKNDAIKTKYNKKFHALIAKKTLPVLRAQAEMIASSDPSYYSFRFQAPFGVVAAVIPPRASYGYIYGVVYLQGVSNV